MLTKNTLAPLVVMVLPVGEDNTKHTHHRGDEKTMRTLETSKQTNVPVCKYSVIAIFQLNRASAETESTGIQLILCDLGVLDRKSMISPSLLLVSFLLLEGLFNNRYSSLYHMLSCSLRPESLLYISNSILFFCCCFFFCGRVFIL